MFHINYIIVVDVKILACLLTIKGNYRGISYGIIKAIDRKYYPIGLQSLLNLVRPDRYVRIKMCLSKFSSKRSVLQTCNWKPIEYYYKRSIACKTYKIYNNLSPSLLIKLIKKSQSRSTRNHFKLDLLRFRGCQTPQGKKDPLKKTKKTY